MNLFRDLLAFNKAMGTLPWYIQVWAILYPLPQILGGLYFIQTLPGFVILAGRVLSLIVASQVHKRAPFSKLMGPIGHAHWLLIVPYLMYALNTQNPPKPLFWFVGYVLFTTFISGIIDVLEYLAYRKHGHIEFKR